MHEVRGHYTFGMHRSIALYLLPEFLPLLLKTYPSLSLSFKHDLSRIITERIISSHIDIGLVINPVKHPDLILKKVFDDQVNLWHTSNIPPSKIPKTLIYDPNLLQAQSILLQLKKEHIHFNQVIESNDLEVITELTSLGIGYGIIPSRVVSHASKKLIKFRPKYSFLDELYLIYRVENKNSKSIQAIAQSVLNTSCLGPVLSKKNLKES